MKDAMLIFRRTLKIKQPFLCGIVQQIFWRADFVHEFHQVHDPRAAPR